MIEEGQKFPDFSLEDQNGDTHTLADFAGQPVVIYFYPKDDTSGCTTEACEFQASGPEFPGVKVVGVSPDSVKSHKKFADKHGLEFTLLADPERHLIEPAGLWVEKSMYGRKYMGVERTTFLLDTEGNVVKVWRKVKPKGHAAAALAAVGS